MKSIIASGLLLGMAHGAAIAGTYANIEANSGFVGSDYSATVIDNHIGYKKDNWYVQAGPSVVAPDGGDTEIEFSGKAGGSVSLADNLSTYAEVSFMTSDADNSYGTKVGFVYEF